MRLIICFCLVLSFTSCGNTSNINDLSIILAYLDVNIKENKFDARIYSPPNPSELKNNVVENKRIKHDSIILKLEPLQLYVSDSIVYDKNLILKDSIKDFFNSKDYGVISKKRNIYLNLSSLNYSKRIVLKPINENKFYTLYPKIKLDDNYGGLIRFDNLYVSKDGTKACFEVTYFKHKLNASSYIVFADYVNKQWKFKQKVITIS